MKKLLSILILILFTTTVKAQLELPYPVKVVNPRSLDYKYLYQGNRPYTDTAEVNATIPLGIRHKGLIVNVNNTLWWYKDSVLNNSLVQIQLGGGISKTYADWGLNNVNDSTLKADSSLLLTKLKGLNLIDSFRNVINVDSPLVYNAATAKVSILQADTSTNGYLSSTDWNTFNDKQTALGFTPENIANKKTTLADNSDTYYPTQKAVKTAVDAKQDIITGGASTITSSNLTGDKALISNGSGKVAVSNTTREELDYVAGVTSSIQTQLNSKIPTSHTVNNISNGTGFLKNNGSGIWSWDGNSYVDLASTQTITGIKTIDNGFTIRDNTAVSISTDERALKLINDKPTGYLLDTISTAPYILFSSKSYVSDFGSYNPPYSSASSTMQWRIRQSLAPAGQVAGQDNKLYFDYKNGDAGSWISAVSISKDGVQGNITGVDQMTLGNYSGNRGKITFKNIGGYTAGSIEAAGNMLRVSDGGSSKIEFFNGVTYFGGSATSTGSQLSANGWALTKTANTTFTASALLHLDKNRSTAGNAPIKFTLNGAALLTTPERGALEAMPYRLHFTDSSNQRNTLAYLSDVAAKQDTITGGATSIVSSNLTADRALVSNGSGKVATSSVTATELGYVSGVTSSIQTQLNAKLTTANSNVKRYIRVNATTNGSNYAMDGTKEVVLIDYTDPCDVTLPAVASLPDGSVFEIQFYNWAQTNKQVTIYPDGTDSETIDKGFGISSGGNLLLKSNPQANSVTPLSLRIMWLAEDNVWTVLQGGVFDY